MCSYVNNKIMIQCCKISCIFNYNCINKQLINIISLNLDVLLSNEHLISLQIFIKFYMKMVELFNVKIIEIWWGITCQKSPCVKDPRRSRYRFNVIAVVTLLEDAGVMFDG